MDIIGAAGYVNGHWISYSNATGMFWTGGKLYYTRYGDSHLYMRYFSPESEMIGSNGFTPSGNGDGLDWSNVRGMTEAGGKIYYATTDGNLHRIDFTGGVPVPGTDVLIGGPGVDGRNWASNGLFLTDPPDTTTPSVPGQPSGTSTKVGTVDLTWGASTDPDNATLTYDVYRDGAPSPIAKVTSSSTTTVSFTDTGLVPGSSHTYAVDATDGTNTSAQSTPSDPILVLSYLFTDDFSGGFAAWTNVTNLTLDSGTFGASAPSALANVTGTTAYAYHTLDSTYGSLCAKVAVNASSIGSSSVTLVRFRTAANASIGRLFVTSGRALYVRADVQGTAFSTGATLPSGWNMLETCLATGATGSWSVWENGSQVGSWTANNGTTDIGRVQIGDTAAVTDTVNYDDVVIDPNHIG